jgi:spore coat protein A
MRIKKILSQLLQTILAGIFVLGAIVPVSFSQLPQRLDPSTIPKWVNQLDGPLPVYLPTNITDDNGNVIRQDYVVSVAESYQQILPTVDANGNPTGFGPTRVFAFGGETKDAITGTELGFVRHAPGPTFEAIRGVPTQVKWVNDLVDEEGNPLEQMFPVDPTLHWANPNNIDMDTIITQFNQGLAPPFPPGYDGKPYTSTGVTNVTNPDGWNAQSPVPISIHLHGGEEPSDYDGTPDQWFTPDGIHGSEYRTAVPTDPNAAVYEYPNSQPATTLWYHDHTLGMTRLNVMSGLSGFYLARDPNDQIAPLLPSGQYDMPLVIQDRIFLSDGSLYYPTAGVFPSYDPENVLLPNGSYYYYTGGPVPPYEIVSNYNVTNPYALGAFLGDAIVVNGKAWPNMNVKQGQYRFRILDASNSRFYLLSLSNGMPFTIIGSDGGYLKAPVTATSLLISPAERYDILVDFSNISPGEKIILQNTALIPPINLPLQKVTLGQIVQFTVTAEEGFAPKILPSQLNPTLEGDFPNLPTPTKQRILTVPENINANTLYAIDLYLNGHAWSSPVSETPELGSTEDWLFVNTFDTHNIHLHLVQFQLVYRQAINATTYFDDWVALNGNPPFDHPTIDLPSLEPYLTGPKIAPTPEEQSWKDTIIIPSGKITVIRVRFAQQDGSPFPFDATAGPGYVWHCHIVEHEDMEMMRPYILTQSAILSGSEIFIIAITATIVALVLISVFVVRVLRSRSHKK